MDEKSEELIDQIWLLNEYKKAVDYSTIVSISDIDGIITYVNDAFIKISGYSASELIGMPHNIIRHSDTPYEVFTEMWKKLLQKKPWQGIIKNRAKNGSVYYVDTTITPILNKHGVIKKFLALRHNITKLIEQENRIAQQLSDKLTGLPNRTKLFEDLENAEFMAIALLNIDSFQELNNLYGHKIGDEILKSFGIFLTANLNDSECRLFKLPSDEYAILFHKSWEKERLIHILMRLIHMLDTHRFMIEGHEIYLSVTGGISCGNGAETLINADIALKNAKRSKLPLEYYDAEKHEKEHYATNQDMIRTLKYSLSHDLITAYYQPLYNNKTKKIDKYETLMRIINEHGEIISPIHFLDIAKKAKIYPELTKVILRKSFEMFKDKDMEFTINLCIEDIRNSNTNAYIFDILSSFNRPTNVIFEIIESEGIEDYAIIKEFITEVKNYGAKVAIDDFGSGYSNFMHLLELQADIIKIDGTIIKNILHDKNSKILTKTITSMAKELNIIIVAEFVSSAEIQKAINDMGIDYSQGYYIGEPKPYLILDS